VAPAVQSFGTVFWRKKEAGDGVDRSANKTQGGTPEEIFNDSNFFRHFRVLPFQSMKPKRKTKPRKCVIPSVVSEKYFVVPPPKGFTARRAGFLCGLNNCCVVFHVTFYSNMELCCDCSRPKGFTRKSFLPSRCSFQSRPLAGGPGTWSPFVTV